MKKALILAGAVLGAVSGSFGVEATMTYELSPVVVTAERMDTEELRTPAAVDVLTADKIRKTGATTVQEALKFATGVITSSQGPKGLAQGTMTAKAVIRGVEKGTLVLVDGVPMNQSGMYQLQDIATDSVEKIEIVRGGGAVLYGSEASGGVINIITKKNKENKIKVSVGNYGQQNYSFSGQAGDKVGFSYTYDKLGRFDHMSDPSGGRPKGMYYNMTDGEHNHFQTRYHFMENLFLTHSYSYNRSHYVYRWDGRNGKNKDAVGHDVYYGNSDQLLSLHYEDEGFTGTVYYHKRDMTTDKWKTKVSPGKSGKTSGMGKKTDKGKKSGMGKNKDKGKKPGMGKPEDKPAVYNPADRIRTITENKDRTIGLDVSKRWTMPQGSVLLGTDFRRDMAHVFDKEKGNDYERNMYSLYGQWSHDFTKETQMNVNLRQTWVEKDKAGNKYNKFTPEVVVSHDIDDTSMMYAKAGKSFMMPTFKQLYGGGLVVASPGLKPQSGTHYEVGYKTNKGKTSLRLALFRYDIKDSLEAKVPKGEVENIQYTNEDIRNTGIECEVRYQVNDKLSYHVGATLGHPEKQERDVDRKVGAWHDYYGKVQLNGGITYEDGKWETAFNFSHLGKRIRDAAPYESFKSQLFTDFHISYQASDDCRLFFNMDNVLDRKDIVSTSSSSFFSLGRNYMVGMDYKF